MPYTVVPQRAGGYAPLEADWDTMIRDNLNGGWALFGKTDPNGATAALTFQSIPQTHKHLKIVWYARLTGAATVETLNIRINGDSTAGNYDHQHVRGDGAAVTAAEAFGSNNHGSLVSGQGVAQSFGIGIIDIPHYTNTANQKAINWAITYKYGTSSGQIQLRSGMNYWRTVSAVTSIDIVAPSVFAVGSRISVYGLG